MRRRRLTFRPKGGDVRLLRIFRGKRSFRLAIHDGDAAVPLIEARLSPAEAQALRRALGPDR